MADKAESVDLVDMADLFEQLAVVACKQHLTLMG
jgi:hypothetical protein